MKYGAGRLTKGQLTGLIIAAVFIVFFAKESLSGTLAPGITDTRHDLSMTSPYPWTYDTTEKCVFCHTPHQGQGTVTPLWNRELSTKVFSMYSSNNSPTFNMGSTNMIVSASYVSPSALCMSCHDGTMAMNAVLNTPGTGSTGSIPLSMAPATLGEVRFPNNPPWWYPGANMSGNYAGNPNVNKLSDEHPIGFTYDPALDAQGNNFPAAVAGRIVGTYRLYGPNSNQFECSTCHDVHDTVMYPKDIAGYEVFFLRTSNRESKMCRDCHINKF